MRPSDVVSQFLLRQAAGDWEACRGFLDEDMVRIGSDGQACHGRATYLELLQQMHSEISEYDYQVQRMTEGVDGDVVLLEIVESARGTDGQGLRLREAMVFQLSAAGRITELRVYTATAPPAPFT